MSISAEGTMCTNGLKHVFVKETRPHRDEKVTSSGVRMIESATMVDDRVVCQRCGQTLDGFDWDGPFERVLLTEETA